MKNVILDFSFSKSTAGEGNTVKTYTQEEIDKIIRSFINRDVLEAIDNGEKVVGKVILAKFNEIVGGEVRGFYACEMFEEYSHPYLSVPLEEALNTKDDIK